MKKILPLALLLVAFGLASAQVHVSTSYTPPFQTGSPTDSVLNGLMSIRGCAFLADAEGDGKGEIAVTNYAGAGRVCIFSVVGKDSIQLVWTSPQLPNATVGASPRDVIWSDLDGDGKNEVTFFLNSGVYIFEHDGVPGSHNYGTTFSQVIQSPNITTSTSLATDFIAAADVDGDGKQEFVAVANYTGTANDKYYIISCVGDYSTDDPGFSSFTTEFDSLRGNLAAWKLNGGSPVAMIPAQLDGSGANEILVHAWDHKTVTVLRSTAANTYEFPDTSTGKVAVRLGGGDDDVALFGGLACDIDGDGRDEVYLPTYPQTTNSHAGWVHMISFNTGEAIDQIDSATNTMAIQLGAAAGTSALFGFGYGDIDGNGKKNLYFSAGNGRNIVTAEFQGGDKRDPANWVSSILYAGDTVYSAWKFIDSADARHDTVKTNAGIFVSKLYGRFTDIDNDGNEDIIMPTQANVDSITTTHITWDNGGSKWDTVITKAANPNRATMKILTHGAPNSVEVRDLTVLTPDDFRLDQNYPNPFNPSTTIQFFLPVRDKISLKIYDVLGREVRTLISGELRDKGTSHVVWDGKNNSGHQVGSGTYFYTLHFGNYEKTNKMTLLK
jgi:hypothetical protein